MKVTLFLVLWQDFVYYDTDYECFKSFPGETSSWLPIEDSGTETSNQLIARNQFLSHWHEKIGTMYKIKIISYKSSFDWNHQNHLKD